MPKITEFQRQQGRGAVLEYKRAPLSGTFGFELFERKAGDRAGKILEELGVFSRGKNEGKPRGFIVWFKVIKGGFDPTFGVVRGGSFGYRVVRDYDCRYDRADYWLEG